MYLLALDIGKNTGWCVAPWTASPVLSPIELAADPSLVPGAGYISGTWKLPDDWGHRGIELFKLVKATVNEHGCDEVCWEVAGYDYKSQDAALGQIGLMMAAAMATRACRLRHETINTADVCRHAVDKAKDPKKALRINRARQLGWECTSDHEIDARWIASTRLAQARRLRAA